MTQSLTRSAVRIYGALTALGNGSTDVLARLLPFFEPILRDSNGGQFDPLEFAASVRNTYHWNFNADIVEVFTPRLVDAGWLTSETDNISDGFYRITVPDVSDKTDAERSAADELTEIAGRFREFSIELSPLTAIPKEVEEYEDILIEWLVYVEAFSEQSIDFRQHFKPDESGTMRTIVDVPNTTSLTDEEKFLCARFVQKELKDDGATAATLARIASIGLLTEVVQDFVRPTDAVDHTNLVVYLDAPNALELLGVSGSAARENTVPVIKELKRIGAQVRIFSQSLDEMKAALSAVLRNPRPTGPTAQAIARGDVLREYVSQVAADPATFLENEGVSVTVRSLEQTPSEHTHFPIERRDELISAQTFQQNLNAREHDADITTLVMRQRRGISNRDIFLSRFIIMTRNGLLAQVVRKACVEMGLVGTSEVPPVVHRRVISASMWLRTGLGAGELDIPKRMLLASCEQVLAVRKGVVEAVKKMTDALGDEEKSRQLDTLIQQDRSTQMLMDKTLGASYVVTAENLPMLFEEMIHPHLEEERKKGQAAVGEERSRARASKAKLTSVIDAERQKTEEAKAEIAKAKKEDRVAVTALWRDVEANLKRRRRNRWGVVVITGIAFGLLAVLGSGPWAIAVGIGANIILAILTLSGSGLIGVRTDADLAFEELKELARQRGLSAKLNAFHLEWNGTGFKEKPPEVVHSDDLLTLENGA